MLRESVTVEAAPERVVRKAVRAERPVTARIRDRRAANEMRAIEPKPEPVAEVIAMPVLPVKEKPAALSAIITPSLDQERGHAGRVARRRQDGGGQLRLF